MIKDENGLLYRNGLNGFEISFDDGKTWVDVYNTPSAIKIKRELKLLYVGLI
jgi:hypothetical protein